MATNNTIDRINIDGDVRIIKPGAENVRVSNVLIGGEDWTPGNVQTALENLRNYVKDNATQIAGLSGKTDLVFGSLNNGIFYDINGNEAVRSATLLYIDRSTGIIYRWGTNSFVVVSKEPMDSTPTSGSQKPITSGGVYNALTAGNIRVAEIKTGRGIPNPISSLDPSAPVSMIAEKWPVSDVQAGLDDLVKKVYGAIGQESSGSGSSATTSTTISAKETVTDGGEMNSQVTINPDGTIVRSATQQSDVTINLPSSSGTLALQSEVGGKQDALVSGQNIKSINGQSVLGAGSMTIHEEQLIEKSYAPAEFSGLGRKYLQKNIVSDKNVLTQAMMQDANTIYVVQYDYDLNGASITVPSGVELKFEGGSIQNGTLVGTVTTLSGEIRFGLDVDFSGTFKCDDVDPRWFGAIAAENTDESYAAAQDFALYVSAALKLVEASKMALYIPKGYWVVKSPIVWTPTFVKIIGTGRYSIISMYKQDGRNYPICFDFQGATVNGYIRDIAFVRERTGGDATNYMGTIFENVTFIAAKISNIRVYRAGIFIRGAIKDCTEISKCHIVSLGYSLVSAFKEDEFDSETANAGNIYCSVDSFVRDNYINAVCTSVGGAITKDKSLFSGAIGSTIVSGNFIDFWKYIIRRVGISGGNTVSNNVFNGNIFDCCFTFGGKSNFRPQSLTFVNNLIWHCRYSTDNAWGLYASDDDDITSKKWCFLQITELNHTIIKNNTFVDGDYAYTDNPLSYPSLDSEVDFPENYVIRNTRTKSNIANDGRNCYINGDKLYKDPSFALLRAPLRLNSTIQGSRTDLGNNTKFDFGDEYYPLILTSPAYGTFTSADLYDYPDKLSAGYTLYTNPTNTNSATGSRIYLENIDGENVYLMKSNNVVDGVVYHDDIFKITSLLSIYKVIRVLDLNIYLVYTGNNAYDYYYGYGEYGATRGKLVLATLPATAQIGRVAILMDGDTPVWYKYGYDGWVNDADTIKKYFPKKNHGTTDNRPYCNKYAGMEYFDETLGKKILWDGSAWVNLDGTALT